MSTTQGNGIKATRRAQSRLGIAFVLPAAVLMAVFFVFPLISAFYYSLIDFKGVGVNLHFVGLANYERMFTDPMTWQALRNNAIWVVIGTISPLVIGMALALLQWNTGRSSVFYRLAFFLPYVLPGIVGALVWYWIYDPNRGWLNRILRGAHLDFLAHGWLAEADTALIAVLVTAIWSYTGFAMVIFLSALRNVDMELVEAATIDGAGSLQRAWHIVLPQIMPVFLMVTTVTLVGGFSVFDIVFIMTGGGPANVTNVLGTHAYRTAFRLNDISYGTTIAILIIVLSVPCAVLMNRLQRRLSLTGMGA
jgi:multiple sugar transport system permease protein/raffinose/stachyose/melibiose transport system permease protein